MALKWVDDARATNWIADALTTMPLPEGLRLAQPVPSQTGSWIVDNWSCSTWLDGEPDGGRFGDIVGACVMLNRWLRRFPRPSWLDSSDDAWRQADRAAWGESSLHIHPGYGGVIADLRQLIRDIDLPDQLVHGDLTGNVLFAAGRPPGVIDLTLYWRPADYAAAIVAVDCYEWEGAGSSVLESIARLPHGEQLLLRASLFRTLRAALVPSLRTPARRIAVHRRTADWLLGRLGS